MLKLALNFYAPTSGTVSLDGRDVQVLRRLERPVCHSISRVPCFGAPGAVGVGDPQSRHMGAARAAALPGTARPLQHAYTWPSQCDKRSHDETDPLLWAWLLC
eukprot:6203209-Pleurochrysis_carterae.AAC.4